MTGTMITVFDKKVAEFKALFAAAPTLVEFGQFQVSDSLKAKLDAAVTAELGVLMLRENPIWVAVSNFIAEPINEESRTLADDVLAAIKGSAFEDKVPVTKGIFTKDKTATEAWAAAQYGTVWDTTGILSAPVPAAPTADQVIAAWRYERYKCGRTATSMARKAIAASKSGLKPDRSNYVSGQIAGAQLVPSGNREIIKYDSKLLADATAKIASSIDKGYIYKFGVQSGRIHENKTHNPYPNPEHYLLAFAQFDNSAFLFWDPDGTTSDIKSRPWGEGFGVIYHRDRRLSTAYDDADFKAIVGNFHANSPRRHLYQVNLAAPVP
jgi:hypothetical protein